MRIAVIGAITRDTLIFPIEGGCRITESVGGALYTIAALATVTNEEVYPVCNVGYDIYQDVVNFLKGYRNVALSAVQKVNTKNIHCYILYASEYGTQYDDGKEVPISFEQVEPLIPNSGFIFVSPSTGFDIPLDVVRRVKRSTKSPMYLDYHILSLGRDKLGHRFLRKRDDWLEWCTNCDYLQLNKFEAESLYDGTINSDDDALGFSEAILNGGVKSVAITMGSKGVLVCYRDGNNDLKCTRIGAYKVGKVIDATGCGDVFAGGFIAHFTETKNLLDSYRFGNKLAGLKTGIPGITGLSGLIRKQGV